eukprot:6978861-Prymnesium_polylepis.1
MQLTISRQQRMAAVSYHAHAPKDAPQHLVPHPSYWSYNYSNFDVQKMLVWWMVATAILTLLHDQRWAIAKWTHSGLGFYKGIQLVKFRQPYTYLVELPSVAVPLLLEFARPNLELPQWTFWITCTKMLLSVRLVQEGSIGSRGLRRLVKVLATAAPNLIALVVVVVPLSVLRAVMHSQLFGLFDDGARMDMAWTWTWTWAWTWTWTWT